MKVIDLRQYAGQTIQLILPGDTVVDPPAGGTKPIGAFDFGVSDSKPGKMYFIIDPGPYASLTIGGQRYEKEPGGYNGRELWYGKGEGAVRLTAEDGTVYVGSTGEVSGGGDRHALKYKGLSNGNRPTYYTYDNSHMRVGDKVSFKVGAVSRSFTAKRRLNGSIGYDWPDGTVVKNSEVSGRGVAVLTKAGSGAHSGGWIEW